MKVIRYLVNLPTSSFYKALYFTVLLTLLFGFSYKANYAMIFRHTAMVVSYLSLAGIIYWFYKFQKEGKSHTLLWITMLSVFTLHKWWLIAVFGLQIISRHLKTEEDIGTSAEQQAGLWQLILLLPAYLVMDIAREFSVWHRCSLNYFPEAGMLFILLLGIYCYRRQR